MKKIISGLSICIWVMFALAAAPTVAQEVHFVPSQSSASYCNTTEVEIWVNATSFQSGQIELTYNPSCANVTDCVRNTTNFPMGAWAHVEDGKDRISFMGSGLKTGEYMIGTLTIHCVNESGEGCATTLDFTEQSKLVDDHGNTVPANWMDGTFECKSLLDGGTESPVEQTPAAGGNTHMRISGGNSQSKDEAEAEEGTIVQNGEDETHNEDVEARQGIHPESDAVHTDTETTPVAQMPSSNAMQGQESMFFLMTIAIALAAVIIGIIGIGIRRRRYRK